MQTATTAIVTSATQKRIPRRHPFELKARYIVYPFCFVASSPSFADATSVFMDGTTKQ
jgi:hypothetical protein